MFEWLVDPCLGFLRKELALNELVKTHNNMLVESFIAMFSSVLEEMMSNADGYTIGKLVLVGLEEPEDVDFEALFVFSLVWSVGASLNAEGRKRFDAFLKDLVQGGKDDGARTITVPFPASSSIYDVTYSPSENAWRTWMDTIDEGEAFVMPTNVASFSDIVVPTKFTAQFRYLIALYITHGHASLAVGPTGSGKSANIRHLLERKFAATDQSIVPIILNFSATTTSDHLESALDQKLTKRRRGVYGPAVGGRCFCFLDDMNLPVSPSGAREEEGSGGCEARAPAYRVCNELTLPLSAPLTV